MFRDKTWTLQSGFCKQSLFNLSLITFITTQYKTSVPSETLRDLNGRDPLRFSNPNGFHKQIKPTVKSFCASVTGIICYKYLILVIKV